MSNQIMLKNQLPAQEVVNQFTAGKNWSIEYRVYHITHMTSIPFESESLGAQFAMEHLAQVLATNPESLVCFMDKFEVPTTIKVWVSDTEAYILKSK